MEVLEICSYITWEYAPNEINKKNKKKLSFFNIALSVENNDVKLEKLKIINFEDNKQIFVSKTNLFNGDKWLWVLSNTYGFRFKAVTDSEESFLLPFCETSDGYFPAIKSIPFGDYTLISYPEKKVEQALQYLKNRFPHYYIETTLVSKKPPALAPFQTVKTGYLIQVNMAEWRKNGNRDAVHERNIKKALANGLEIKTSRTKTSLHNFYTLHEQLRIKKFKKLAQPFRFFEAIYQEFIMEGKGFLLEARHQRDVIASWLVLEHGDTLYYKFGASDPDKLYLRPNDLLFRSLLEFGQANGFRAVDLGYSGAAKSYEGLIRFKSKEGGDKITLYHVEYFPPGFDKGLMEKKRQFLTTITQKAMASGSRLEMRRVSNEYYRWFG